MKRKLKIIYQDETVFSKSTLIMKTFSSKGVNIEMVEGAEKCEPTTVLAAVSKETGLEHIAIQKK